MAAIVTALLTIASAPAAGADIIGPQDPDSPEVNSPWQAGTCKADPPPPGQCSVATPGLFFEEAAGHPPKGFTQFIVNEEEVELIPPLVSYKRPVGNLRTVRVDLPAGLSVNPQATEQCELEPEETPANCSSSAPESKVGVSELTAVDPKTGASLVLHADVYNIVPEVGEPARFGFSIAGSDVFLEADIEWEGDYHQYFTIHAHKIEVEVVPGELARVAKNRLTFDGDAGDGTFITTPTTCLGPASPGSPFEQIYSTWLRADSFEEENPSFPHGSNFLESKIPRDPPAFETSPKNCEDIPFDPSISVDPNTSQTDSPAGATVTVNLPEIKNPLKDEASKATSQVRSARVTLPAGMGLNPSAANGLVACTDAQFGKGTRAPEACPAASRIGSVEVDTPPLPSGSLSGPVYVGRQLSRDPASGDLYRIFVAVESARYDISARLLGKVSANPQTGQLTTSFDDAPLGSVPIPGLPQVPFKSFRFEFDGGPKAPLTSPPTCGPNTTDTQMTPWSSAQGIVPPGEPGGPSTETSVAASSSFSLTGAPGGGACAKSLADRPFSPGFAAGVDRAAGGAYSPLQMEIERPAGEQELKGVEVTLPPGLSAKLAGVEYCPEGALAAAAGRSGRDEAADPSCPGTSLLGSATVRAGSGPEPLEIAGKVFLAGPHQGAPLSLAVVTPATAGPFDLGSVVVRVALFVDPRTARVTARSDAIPHVYGGALLTIRSVDVRLDRPEFSLNPTSCEPLGFDGALRGGGGDPTDPGAFSSHGVSAPFQAGGCERLGFRPRLFLRTFGGTRRARHPKLRAVLLARPGDANIGRAAVILPRSIILDQGNIANVCTRVQFAARACPKRSVYGFARAFSPLLDEPLQGPVYLRSSDNLLPDLVADLRGQVNIELAGRTDSVRGRLRNTFDVVPDVPVRKFVLTVRGGRRGLLVNSTNLCPRPLKLKGKGKRARRKAIRARRRAMRAIVRFNGHNGKRANRKQRVRTPCAQKRRRSGHRRAARR